MIDWLGLFGLLMIVITSFVYGYMFRGWLVLLNDKIRIMKNLNQEKIMGKWYQPRKDCGCSTCECKPPKFP